MSVWTHIPKNDDNAIPDIEAHDYPPIVANFIADMFNGKLQKQTTADAFVWPHWRTLFSDNSAVIVDDDGALFFHEDSNIPSGDSRVRNLCNLRRRIESHRLS